MLRPICPTVVIGRTAETTAIVAMLEDIGAPVLAQAVDREIYLLLADRDPSLVVVDATSSLVSLELVAAALSPIAAAQRPLLLAVVSQASVGSLPYTDCLDDFVVWPCEGDELEARLALARWRRVGLTGEGVLRSGELAIDVRRHRVVVAGREVVLTVREYELLRALVEARGEVLTRDGLLSNVWGADYLGGARTVDIHIWRLRSKIAEIEDRIVTVRGVGYRLVPEGES